MVACFVMYIMSMVLSNMNGELSKGPLPLRGNDIATRRDYIPRHGHYADLDYHHYNLGFPGAVGAGLELRNHRHPVSDGAVSFPKSFNHKTPLFRCAPCCGRARAKTDG